MLRDGVPRIAAVLGMRAEERGLTRVNERDHLQPWSVEILREVAMDEGSRLRVGTSFRLDYPEHWPGVGNVDLTLTGGGAPPVLVELKCGAGSDALGPCAWDVAKSALTLRMGTACATYLLGATTTAMWQRPVRGAEFFHAGQWDTANIRSRYEDWWRSWQKRPDPLPRRLTLRGSTQPIAAARFSVAGTDWELRLARVTVEPSGWFEWQPFR